MKIDSFIEMHTKHAKPSIFLNRRNIWRNVQIGLGQSKCLIYINHDKFGIFFHKLQMISTKSGYAVSKKFFFLLLVCIFFFFPEYTQNAFGQLLF